MSSKERAELSVQRSTELQTPLCPFGGEARASGLFSPEKETWAGKDSILSSHRAFSRSKAEGVGRGEGDLLSKHGVSPTRVGTSVVSDFAIIQDEWSVLAPALPACPGSC